MTPADPKVPVPLDLSSFEAFREWLMEHDNRALYDAMRALAQPSCPRCQAGEVCITHAQFGAAPTPPPTVGEEELRKRVKQAAGFGADFELSDDELVLTIEGHREEAREKLECGHPRPCFFDGDCEWCEEKGRLEALLEERRARSGSARDEGGVTTWPLRGFQSPLPQPAAAEPPPVRRRLDFEQRLHVCNTIRGACRCEPEVGAAPCEFCAAADELEMALHDLPSEPPSSAAPLPLVLREVVESLRADADWDRRNADQGKDSVREEQELRASAEQRDREADAILALHASHLAAEERATRFKGEAGRSLMEIRRLRQEIGDADFALQGAEERATRAEREERRRYAMHMEDALQHERERDALKGELERSQAAHLLVCGHLADA